MTINKARKILGEPSHNLSNEEIQRDIDTAKLLKDLFFNNLIELRKNATIKLITNSAEK